MKPIAMFLLSLSLAGQSVMPMPETLETDDTVHLRMFIAGDALLHESVYTDAMKRDGTFDFHKQLDGILDQVKDYDLAYYNQETILGGTALGLSGYPTFNSPMEFGEYMVEKGFNLVSTANNHCLDKGTAGIEASREFWNSQRNVAMDGTNAMEYESHMVPSIKVKGVRVALLSYTYGTNGVIEENDWQVNDYPGNEKEMLARVQKARVENDIVVVAMHWGTEYSHEVNDEQKTLARKLVEAGATIIIGNHPHAIQPFEWIGDVPVFYAMGNLVSTQIGEDRRTGMLGSLHIDVDHNGKVTVSNARVAFTYVKYTGDLSVLRTDIEVLPFSRVTNAILPNPREYEQTFRDLMTSMDNKISFGLK